MKTIFFFSAIAVHLLLCKLATINSPGSNDPYDPFLPWLALFVASIAIIVYQFAATTKAWVELDDLRKNDAKLTDDEYDVVKAMRDDKK